MGPPCCGAVCAVCPSALVLLSCSTADKAMDMVHSQPWAPLTGSTAIATKERSDTCQRSKRTHGPFRDHSTAAQIVRLSRTSSLQRRLGGSLVQAQVGWRSVQARHFHTIGTKLCSDTTIDLSMKMFIDLLSNSFDVLGLRLQVRKSTDPRNR